MEAFVASTPQQARLLLDLGNARLLALLMTSARSAGSLAGELTQDVRRVHYKIGRLCEAGLVRVKHEEKRAGRAVKYYEAVATAYEVPFALTDAATLRELLGAMYDPFVKGALDRMARSLEGREAHTLRLSLENDRELSVQPNVNASEVQFGAWGMYSLTPERARELRAKLAALSEEYRGGTEEAGARPYLLGLILADGELPD